MENNKPEFEPIIKAQKLDSPLNNVTVELGDTPKETTCEYAGKSYSVGAKICMDGLVHHCNHTGAWIHYNEKC